MMINLLGVGKEHRNIRRDMVIVNVMYHRGNQLTNRFHVAVRLFSNRSQMTSKCGKNKKVAHEAIAECVTDVLITFSRPL